MFFLVSCVNKDILQECIVDKTLPPSDDGNYLDCSLDETAKEGKTDCCDLDGQIGCCKKGAKYVFNIPFQ